MHITLHLAGRLKDHPTERWEMLKFSSDIMRRPTHDVDESVRLLYQILVQ